MSIRLLYTQIHSTFVLLTLNMSINLSDFIHAASLMVCPFHPLLFYFFSFKTQQRYCFPWEAVPDPRVDLDVIEL